MMPGVHGGSMIGQDPDVAAEVTRAVCDAVDIPVMMKLTPDQSRPVEIARKVSEAGAAAVTATNRYIGFVVDVETGSPRMGGPAGLMLLGEHDADRRLLAIATSVAQVVNVNH
jgi:dihydroorotate dehydrogenase (fumarate)/dihydropyrimidine dehydrogenase (NAD+) subunit PreA